MAMSTVISFVIDAIGSRSWRVRGGEHLAGPRVLDEVRARAAAPAARRRARCGRQREREPGDAASRLT